MKASRILTMVVYFGAILIFLGCGKNTPAESTQDKQLGLLSHTWKMSSASLDGSDKTADWSGFQLTISGTKGSSSFTYSCANRSTKLGPWPASGTWTFDATTPETLIIRTEDNLKMNYIVTTTSLQISFNYPTTATGYTGPRLSNISGNWVYIFSN